MDENFSPQQSLQLIESLIRKVCSNIRYNRFYFLFWGWLTFLAILTQIFLKVALHYCRHYFPLIAATAILASYIIPGHLANRDFHKAKCADKAVERV